MQVFHFTQYSIINWSHLRYTFSLLNWSRLVFHLIWSCVYLKNLIFVLSLPPSLSLPRFPFFLPLSLSLSFSLSVCLSLSLSLSLSYSSLSVSSSLSSLSLSSLPLFPPSLALSLSLSLPLSPLHPTSLSLPYFQQFCSILFLLTPIPLPPQPIFIFLILTFSSILHPQLVSSSISDENFPYFKALPPHLVFSLFFSPAVTVKNGGNVLVPCYASGVTFDLFECLSGHLEQCGLSGVPMYFLSPVSDSTLAYSNIFAEW